MFKALQAFVSVPAVCCLASSQSCCLVSYVLCYLYHFAPQGLRLEKLCFLLPLYPKFIASGFLRYPRYANLGCIYVSGLTHGHSLSEVDFSAFFSALLMVKAIPWEWRELLL